MKPILAIDQGTTGSTALVVAPTGETLARANFEFPQYFPKPGWVEHDLDEIWKSVENAVKKALSDAKIRGEDLAGIGITNQRETTALWDRKTGGPIHRAIVWQCRRTADTCAALERDGKSDLVKRTTGLVLDAYFSGTKIAWILDHVSGARARAEKGELAFGTIDTFVVHKLTSGAKHVTDVTNASRTLLMNLKTLAWDESMLEIFRVPRAVLPEIAGSAEIVAETRGAGFLPDGIPIAGIAGDQQAALFGQACFAKGDAKCTYGTGAFALVNTGSDVVFSKHGLLTTVAWKIDGKTTYAIEGSAFIAGAAVQWLRDGLGIIKNSADVEALAKTVSSSENVVFVPAFVGLGAPHWNPDARGLITGITRGTTAAHIARATLEGIAFSVWDLLSAMIKDAGDIKRLRVDGGASRNDLLMQFQSDVANIVVERPFDVESTGRGAAMLAGVALGQPEKLTTNAAAMAPNWSPNWSKVERTFSPAMPEPKRAEILQKWAAAVALTTREKRS